MYHLVQDLSADDAAEPVVIGDKPYPTPSVLEDERGIRLLLLTSRQGDLPARVWVSAHSLGIGYLMVPGSQGWFTQLVEHALENKTEIRGQVIFDDSTSWREFPDLPTYRDILLHDDSREEEAATAAEAPITGFVHVHLHTDYSPLDGMSQVSEAVQAVVGHGQQAMAATDHGNVAVHPELAKEAAAAGIKPIFGLEAYLVPDRHRRPRTWWVKIDPDSGVEFEVNPEDYSEIERKDLVRRTDQIEVKGEYQHITLWALDNQGLRNLWSMSTESYREGFYYYPRLDYDTMERFSEGVAASTGCLRGPLAVPFLAGDQQQARMNVARLSEIFGDRLYIEVHANHLPDQIRTNQFALEVGRDMGIPLIAAQDSHYTLPEEKPVHQAWLAMQTNKDLSDDTDLFAGKQDYHISSEEEIRQALLEQDLPESAVEEAIANTAVLANRCAAELVGETNPPVFSKPSAEHPDPVRRDMERVVDQCLDAWADKIQPKIDAGIYTVEDAEARLERECRLLSDKRFFGYYLVVSEYVMWAKARGCLVGPGRGSGGGSLVAYLVGITDLDPLQYDLPFERFLHEGRKGLPDFDVDFPTTWREPLKAHIRERWGEDYTLSIGTVSRVRIKAAFDSAVRVLKSTTDNLPTWDETQLFKAAVQMSISDAAGTAVTWETFVSDHADLVETFTERYPELMVLVAAFVDRVKTYGKHPAGVVVSTDKPLTDLPMRVGDEGELISQFDMVALEELGYVKFDLLTLRNLDTIQNTVDLIRERFDTEIDVYSWHEEYEDPQVWEDLSEGNTLGVFQIETAAGTRLTTQYRPGSVMDLAAVITLVRPGPKRSGLTDTYLLRRDGEEAVSYVDARLETVLGPTYGVPIYQEQVMGITMALAGYDAPKADGVRKILGKKQVEKVVSAGQEFVAAAVENGMDQRAAESLWEQLAEFAKYGFGKAHAVGYAVLGFWTAWLKTHYPAQFLTAVLSTVDDERIPDFVSEARRLGYLVEPPDINTSGVHFTPTDLTVRYGLASVAGVGISTAQQIIEGRPYASVEDFRERCLTKGSKVNHGHLKALARVGAFDSLHPNRRALDLQIEAESDGSAVTCVFKDESALGPGGLPCVFDWDNEPDPPMTSRGRGKNKIQIVKPPPKRCTRACRNFTPPPPVDPEGVEPYTAADIRNREKEMLGVWLSSTPFDRVPKEDLETFHTAQDLISGPVGSEYVVVSIVERVKENTDRNGNRYAFLTLNAREGSVDAICFASVYGEIRGQFKKDDLVYCSLYKNERGFQILDLIPSP